MFIVSDQITDIMPGYEFLRDNHYEWSVGKAEMKIMGHTVKMVRREGGINDLVTGGRET